MKEILQDGNPVLREIAQEVLIKDIPSKEIKTLLKNMVTALKDKEFGVALAAPQIGVSKRVFIVAEKVFEEDKKEETLVYINPKIVKKSRKTDDLEEGCLSVEGYFGTVTRAKLVTVEAYDETGTKFTRGASGLLAQIFQHEIDHLNGVLYVDHAHNIREVDPSKK
ncbi:MAG: peptide deformylase [Candidatus Paceibacterota bacterium]